MRKIKIKLGLIGYPVEHSYSSVIHEAFLSYFGLNGQYHLFSIPELPAGEMRLLQLLEKVRQGEILGLNVTIPHKEAVIRYLDCLTETAKKINAVNTIICDNGKLIGENTDALGFYNDLMSKTRNIFETRDAKSPMMKLGKCALILGAGGGARAVAFSLIKSGWQLIIAARQVSQGEVIVMDLKMLFQDSDISAISLNETELDMYRKKVKLLINCTPVGMYPNNYSCPWPENISLPEQCFVYDLIYNPKDTKLIQLASEQGLPYSGGIGMLIEQAALSFKNWLGLDPPRDLMAESLGKLI